VTAVLAFLLVAGTTAAGWQGHQSPRAAASRPARASVSRQAGARSTTGSRAPASPGTTPDTAATAAGSRALSAGARRSCPATASACVDLAAHLTWLQSGGRIFFGPVRMEPGPPGTVHATPRGTFQVQWKAGPDYISNIYHEPMPWAVFFAPGGVAFHAGSLTKASHGCVHLTLRNALYYHEHLPVGAEVVVF
jgi:hypothetical protein